MYGYENSSNIFSNVGIHAFDNKRHLCKENNLETDGIPSLECLW